MLHLYAKKNSTNHFFFYASYEHYAVTTSLLGFHGLLPVTPSRKTVKHKITISQQLLGRFRSSFQELKPYPYASYFVISVYTKIHSSCVNVPYIIS
jgi:hypothetical protein